MRIYFNLNTVVGKVMEKKQTLVLLGLLRNVFFFETFVSVVGEGQIFCLMSAFSAFLFVLFQLYLFSFERKKY